MRTIPGFQAGIGGGVGVSKMFKLNVKVVYLMGKALSGGLSCTWAGLVAFLTCTNKCQLERVWSLRSKLFPLRVHVALPSPPLPPPPPPPPHLG